MYECSRKSLYLYMLLQQSLWTAVCFRVNNTVRKHAIVCAECSSVHHMFSPTSADIRCTPYIIMSDGFYSSNEFRNEKFVLEIFPKTRKYTMKLFIFCL